MIRFFLLLFALTPVLLGQAVTNLEVQEISSHGVSVEYQMTGTGWTHVTLWGDPDATDSELDFVQGFDAVTTTGANRYLRFVGGTAGAPLSLSVALLNNPASVDVLPLGGSATDPNVVYHVTCSGTAGCTNCTSADQSWAAASGSGLDCSTTDGSWPTVTMDAESGLGATAPVLTGLPDWKQICEGATPVTEVSTLSALQTAFASAWTSPTDTLIPVTPGDYEISERWNWGALGARNTGYICVESAGELPEWGASATLAHYDDWVRLKPTGHFLQARTTTNGTVIDGANVTSRVAFRGVAVTQPPISELPKTVCTVTGISGNELTVSGCDPVAAGWTERGKVVLDLPGMDLIDNYPISTYIEDFIGNCSSNVCISSTKVVLETSVPLSGQAGFTGPGKVTMAMGHTISNITHDGTKLQVDFDTPHGFSQDLLNTDDEQVALLRIQIDGAEASGSWFAQWADADSLFLCDASSGACTSSALGTYSASPSDYMLTRNRTYNYAIADLNDCSECAWLQGGYISPRLGPYNPQNMFSFTDGSDIEFSGNLLMEAVWWEPTEPGSIARDGDTFPESVNSSGINTLLITAVDGMRIEGNTSSGMGTAQINAQNTASQLANISITKNVFRQNEYYWTDDVGTKFGTPGVTAMNRHGGGIEFKVGCLNCLVEGNIFSGNWSGNDGGVDEAPIFIMTHTVTTGGPFVATELAINYNIFERAASGIQLTGASSFNEQRNWAPFRAIDIIGNVVWTNHRYAQKGGLNISAAGFAIGLLRGMQHLRFNNNSIPLTSGDGAPFWIGYGAAHGEFDSNLLLYPTGTDELFFVNESNPIFQVRPWNEANPPEKWTTFCFKDCTWTDNHVLAGIDESTFWANHTDPLASRAGCELDLNTSGSLAAGTDCIQNSASFKDDWQTIWQGDYSAGTMTHVRQSGYETLGVGADVDEIWRRHGLPQNVVMNRTSASVMEIAFDAPHASETWVLKVSCDGSTWSQASDSAATVARTISVGSLSCSTGAEWRLEGPGRTVTGVEP